MQVTKEQGNRPSQKNLGMRDHLESMQHKQSSRQERQELGAQEACRAHTFSGTAGGDRKFESCFPDHLSGNLKLLAALPVVYCPLYPLQSHDRLEAESQTHDRLQPMSMCRTGQAHDNLGSAAHSIQIGSRKFKEFSPHAILADHVDLRNPFEFPQRHFCGQRQALLTSKDAKASADHKVHNAPWTCLTEIFLFHLQNVQLNC